MLRRAGNSTTDTSFVFVAGTWIIVHPGGSINESSRAPGTHQKMRCSRVRDASEDEVPPDEEKPPAPKRSKVSEEVLDVSGDTCAPNKEKPPAKEDVPADPDAAVEESQAPANDSKGTNDTKSPDIREDSALG